MRSRRALKMLAAAAMLGGLAACANPQADQALYAQQAFIGMPKQTLLSCAGVPARSATIDNVDYFTYVSQRITTDRYPSPRFGAGYYHPWYGPGWGPWGGYGAWGWPDEVEIESRDCQATFTLRNGTVTQLVYGGATDSQSRRLGQCYQIVENCLALIPQQQVQPASTSR